MYYVTSFRNRGDAYHRLVQSIIDDVQSPVNTVPPQCLCLTIANYNDTVVGVPVDVALRDWPYEHATTAVAGPFSRAGGFQRVFDTLVTTPWNASIAFLVDTDMITYPGFLNQVASKPVRGKASFAPVCWSTNSTNVTDREGIWRVGGTGMTAFYLSDLYGSGFKVPGQLPMIDKVRACGVGLTST